MKILPTRVRNFALVLFETVQADSVVACIIYSTVIQRLSSLKAESLRFGVEWKVRRIRRKELARRAVRPTKHRCSIYNGGPLLPVSSSN